MKNKFILYCTYQDLAKSVLVLVFDHETRASNAKYLATLTLNSRAEIEQYFDEWQLVFDSCLRPPPKNLNDIDVCDVN